MGHAANIPESMRVVDIGMPFSYLAYQVLDTVRLVDFRHITRVNDPLPAYDDNSAANPVYTLGVNGPYYKYTEAIPYALLPGIGVIDAINFNFSGEGVPVSITFRQMQVNTTSNLKAVAERVEILNTSAENVTENAEGEASGGSGGYPGQGYRCPPGTTIQDVIIIPGEVKASSSTTIDPCCNTTTTTGDIVTDPSVTVLCVGVCDQPDGCPEDDWPLGCIDGTFIGYEPHTDTEIGNTEPLVFDIYNLDLSGAGCPVLVAINYPGKVTPDVCVQYADKCAQYNEGNAVFGLLTVYPCIFNKPEGQYSKGIELVFDVPYCVSQRNSDGKVIASYIRLKRVHIVVPVSLRPVSDINVS
jgi:hypothetical protein